MGTLSFGGSGLAGIIFSSSEFTAGTSVLTGASSLGKFCGIVSVDFSVACTVSGFYSSLGVLNQTFRINPGRFVIGIACRIIRVSVCRAVCLRICPFKLEVTVPHHPRIRGVSKRRCHIVFTVTRAVGIIPNA